MKKMRLKRVFDISLSFIGLTFVFPLLLLIGLAVKATSKGSILYISERIGLGGQLFWLYKFRTMSMGADAEAEGSITVGGDRRVTAFGQILRRFKRLVCFG